MRDRNASVKFIPIALVILALVALFQKCSSQLTQIPVVNGMVHLDTVVITDSLSKSEIYLRSKVWVSDYFKSGKAVIDLDDKEAGVLIGNGNSLINVGIIESRCYYTLKISMKENKYRFEVYDFSYKPDNGNWIGNTYMPPPTTTPDVWFLPMGNNSKKLRLAYRDETLRVINELFSSVSSALAKPITQTDNW